MNWALAGKAKSRSLAALGMTTGGSGSDCAGAQPPTRGQILRRCALQKDDAGRHCCLADQWCDVLHLSEPNTRPGAEKNGFVF
jgi:hypothetical protein